MKKLLILAIANTFLFTIAKLIDIPIWTVLLAEAIGFFAWIAWRTWCHPAQQLVNQAAHMNWLSLGVVRDQDGYRDALLERDGVIARVSYQQKCVFLTEPEPSGPYKDFLEIERLLAK